MSKQKDNHKKSSLIGTVSIIMIIVMIGKVTGLIRDALFLSSYGDTSMESQAFSLASMIPRNFLDFAFASSISASFIPIFNHLLEKEGKESAEQLANQFISLIFILSTIATLVLFVFSSSFVSVVGNKLSYDTQMLTVSLLRILLPSIVFSGIAFSLTGILESFDKFNAPAFMSVLSNIIICSYLIFFNDSFGIFGLAIAYLIGWVSQLLVLLPSLKKTGFLFRPSINFTSAPMKEVGKLAIPVLISGWVTPINSLVNASMAGDRIVSLEYAYNLYTVIAGVFVLSIANVVFPRLSRLASSDTGKMEESLQSTLSGMLFLLIPLSVGVFLLAEPMVKLVFERGAFDANATFHMKNALQFYALGMAGYGIQTIVSRGFYAQKDGVTPLITSMFCIVLNYVLGKIFTPYLGVRGPALAWSISLTATSIIMLFVLSKKQSVWQMSNTKNLLKVMISAAIMGVVVYQVTRLPLHFFVSMMLAALIGVIVFFIAAFILKTDESQLIQEAIKKRRAS